MELYGTLSAKEKLIGTINYGNRGPKGDTGPQGIQGPKGDPGETGPKALKILTINESTYNEAVTAFNEGYQLIARIWDSDNKEYNDYYLTEVVHTQETSYVFWFQRIQIGTGYNFIIESWTLRTSDRWGFKQNTILPSFRWNNRNDVLVSYNGTPFWTEYNAVPDVPNSTDTYILKAIAGTLTWVKE